MLPDRTGHACAQCRRRKQKCGGFTPEIKCRPCTKRNVKCSFQDEVHDARYNPYLRIRRRSSTSHSPVSPFGNGERTAAEETVPLSSISSSLGSQSDSYSLSTSQGPLKTLNNFQTEDRIEYEQHDPIARSILTHGETHVLFRLYFTNCHPNAPFLDVSLDSDPNRVRLNSTLLLLAILSVGARFWSASSRTPCWLHPRYLELIRLLDAEVMRVTLRPGPDDQKLETVQALMLCAHWMPFDISADRKRSRSRFSEEGAWQCLGLAIRWATSLALERSCHVAFKNRETLTRADVGCFRTMLYLAESDHYLALSARRPSVLKPGQLYEVLDSFTRSKYVQTTDIRIVSLFRVAYSAHFTDCRPTTIESVEAFDTDVQLIENHFSSTLRNGLEDSLSQHFPFTSLRWYRLSYACAFLDGTDPAQQKGKALTWAIEWASQILLHLSKPPLSNEQEHPAISVPLEPDSSVVEIMSFAIDHYFVVITYAAFFLVNSWLSNFIDYDLRPRAQQSDQALIHDISTSLLFRLVDVASRTLEAASPSEGHLARRYVPVLRKMAGIVLSSNMQQSQRVDVDSDIVVPDSTTQPMALQQNNWEAELWDVWQQAGLDSMFYPGVFDDTLVP